MGALLPTGNGYVVPQDNKHILLHWIQDYSPKLSNRDAPSLQSFYGAQFFRPSDATCSKPTYFGLPFFLKDFGPVFQEWSVTGHESRPGHHTQVQGV